MSKNSLCVAFALVACIAVPSAQSAALAFTTAPVSAGAMRFRMGARIPAWLKTFTGFSRH